MSAADRITEYLRQRAELPDPHPVIASPLLYPNRGTQPLTLEDLQEVLAIAADLNKATRAIKRQAWDEAIDWAWKPGDPDHHPDNPYLD